MNKQLEKANLAGFQKQYLEKWLLEHKEEENKKREDGCFCRTCLEALTAMKRIDKMITEIKEK